MQFFEIKFQNNWNNRVCKSKQYCYNSTCRESDDWINTSSCCTFNEDGSLTIKQLEEDMTGIYECEVENIHGKDKTEFEVSAAS